jgi:phosphoglycerate dehydrogenase-like enzyme
MLARVPGSEIEWRYAMQLHDETGDRSATSHHPLVVVARVDAPPPGLPEDESGVRYVFASNEEQLRRALREAEIMFAWNFAMGFGDPAIFRNTFADAPRLRWIHTAGVGVERMLFPELVASDVILTNSGGVYEQSMAEYAAMLMLQMAKDAVHTWEDQRAHRWNFRRVETLEGRVLLIIGAGPIGRSIARLARAFKMEVTGVARSRRDSDPDFGTIYPSSELLDIVGTADYVVLVAPLLPETTGLIGKGALNRMKPTARLINLGRGPLIDEAALLEAVREGRIAGAALDVYWEEPLPAAHPLWDVPDVIVSPHMAGDITNTHERFVHSFQTNLTRWLAGLPLQYVIDKSLGFRPTT